MFAYHGSNAIRCGGQWLVVCRSALLHPAWAFLTFFWVERGIAKMWRALRAFVLVVSKGCFLSMKTFIISTPIVDSFLKKMYTRLWCFSIESVPWNRRIDRFELVNWFGFELFGSFWCLHEFPFVQTMHSVCFWPLQLQPRTPLSFSVKILLLPFFFYFNICDLNHFS